jgi:hypothetical protein
MKHGFDSRTGYQTSTNVEVFLFQFNLKFILGAWF